MKHPSKQPNIPFTTPTPLSIVTARSLQSRPMPHHISEQPSTLPKIQSCPRIRIKYFLQTQENTSLIQWIHKCLWCTFCSSISRTGHGLYLDTFLLWQFLMLIIWDVRKSYKIKQIITKCWKIWGSLRRKILRTFQIPNSFKLFSYVGIKKCHDKDMSEYNINPSWTTNYTYISWGS